MITKTTNDKKYHSVLCTEKFFKEGDEIDIPEEIETLIIWEESAKQTTKTAIEELRYVYKGGDFIKGFSINSKLNFGMYRNIETGIVYACDLGYIEWCILNLEDFYIVDIEELQEFGVFRRKADYFKERVIASTGYLTLMKDYKTIQKLSSELPFL